PVDKEAGSSVSSGTTNLSGYLRCEATRVGEDTTLSQIIKMVSDAAATKAPIAKIADKVSGIFVPTILCIALVTLIIWLAVGESVGYSLARAISVLVISCPCALGLATPVAIMVGSGVGAKSGILFKTAASVEETGRAGIVVLDKTGTVTAGTPKVTDVLPYGDFTAYSLISFASALERKSEHPLAKAIIEYADEQQLDTFEVLDFNIVAGKGLVGRYEDKALAGGNLSFVSEHSTLPPDVEETAKALAGQGKTPLFFAYDGGFAGIIAVADVIKDDAVQAVKELKGMGLKVVMLTGDNEVTAKAIASQAGIEDVIAGVLPDGKAQVVESLKAQGKVVMVGDGINDAPALTSADIGMAIGAGTDVAVDAASVVLVKSRLSDVPAAIRLGRATLRVIHQNLFWAFIYNALLIPFAAGAFAKLMGWSMDPMYGAAAMSLSSFCVVMNALRLNLKNIHSAKHDRPQRHHHSSKSKQQKADCECESVCPAPQHKENNNEILKSTDDVAKENTDMKKVMHVEGMMCSHCEARVQKALEALAEVKEAKADHESGLVLIKLFNDVDDDVLKQAVEAQDYKVTGIETKKGLF
ncbi:MAG: metal-transporting ATPase, partial [Clostridia bacterium]|nr:metal-transporting ATPase [Clostridia bacterium]